MEAVDVGWTRIGGNALGFAFSMPAGWRAVDLGRGAIAALSPERGEEHYRTNVTLARALLPGLDELEAYGDRHLRELERALTDFEPIDVCDARLGPLPAVRITAAFRQGVYELTLDEWIGISASAVVSATGIAADLDYPAAVGIIERIVASVE